MAFWQRTPPRTSLLTWAPPPMTSPLESIRQTFIYKLDTHIAQSESFTLQIGQSLVQNGGFETGDFTGWTLVGNTIVYNWRGNSTVYDAVEDAASGYDVVHSGTYGAFLGDDQLATLSQSLTTVAGQNYLLSFWLDNPVSGSVQAIPGQLERGHTLRRHQSSGFCLDQSSVHSHRLRQKLHSSIRLRKMIQAILAWTCQRHADSDGGISDRGKGGQRASV